MSDVHTSTMSLGRKLLVASGATIAIAAASAAPALAQASSDTTGHTAPAKTDSTAMVMPMPAPGSGGAGKGAVFQIQMGGQLTPVKGGNGVMVFQMGPATPAKPQQAPQIQVAGDSTKADSAKAAADTTKADAGKKP